MKVTKILARIDAIQLITTLCVLLFIGTMFATFRAGAQANLEATIENRQYGKRIEVYTRATNCFQSVPAAQRTDLFIDQCYDLAETAVGVKVERYGNH